MSCENTGEIALSVNTKNSTRKPPRRFSSSKPKNRDSKRQPMLTTRRVGPFKYDMKEILEKSSMEPSTQSSFLASLIAKATRTSIKDAKMYARDFIGEEGLSEEEYSRVSRLLDRYSKYR